MLRVCDAIRVEGRTYKSRIESGRSPIKLYIFKCRTCESEISSGESYLKAHSGLCVTCSNRISQVNAVAKIRLRPYENIYNRIQNRGKYSELTYEEFLTFTYEQNCHYCGNQIKWSACGSKGGYRLDRMDNNSGYSKNNCVVCCAECNRTKGSLYTYEEFMLLSPILRMIVEARSKK